MESLIFKMLDFKLSFVSTWSQVSFIMLQEQKIPEDSLVFKCAKYFLVLCLF